MREWKRIETSRTKTQAKIDGRKKDLTILLRLSSSSFSSFQLILLRGSAYCHIYRHNRTPIHRQSKKRDTNAHVHKQHQHQQHQRRQQQQRPVHLWISQLTYKERSIKRMPHSSSFYLYVHYILHERSTVVISSKRIRRKKPFRPQASHSELPCVYV